MAIARKFQNSFTTGLLSPSVSWRTDLQKYAAGCTRLENAVVIPQGGVRRRPGISNVISSTGEFHVSAQGLSLLFPFQYSDSDSAVIGIGAGKIVIFTPDNSPLYPKCSAVTISQGVPYSASDVAGIRFVQSGDVVFLVHRSYVPRKLYRTISDNVVSWNLEKMTFQNINTRKPSSVNYGDADNAKISKTNGNDMMMGSRVPKQSYESTGDDPAARYYRMPMQYGVSLVDENGIEGEMVKSPEGLVKTSWPSGGIINVTWTTPDDSVAISGSTGSNDINGTYSSRGTFNGEAIYRRNSPYRYILRACRRTGTSPDYSYAYYWALCSSGTIGTWSSADRIYIVQNEPGQNGEILYCDGNIGDAAAWHTPDASAASVPSSVSTTIYSGAKYYIYKNMGAGWGFIGSSETKSFSDTNISPDYTVGMKKDSDPFGDVDGSGTNPGSVGIYQQRLILAGTGNARQMIWMSESGSFDSFGYHEPTVDSDAIEAAIDSRMMNDIMHFASLKYGVVFTSGAEYMLSAGRNNDAITPRSIHMDLQSSWGSSDVPPLVVGDHILFVQSDGLHIRDIAYQYTQDGFVGEELTVMVDGILDAPIADWCYQQSPYGIVWMVLGNGRLFSMTYMREQQVFAWAEHTMRGVKFISCACIRDSGSDSPYFIADAYDRMYESTERTILRMGRFDDGDGVFNPADGKNLYPCNLDFCMAANGGLSKGDEITVASRTGDTVDAICVGNSSGSHSSRYMRLEVDSVTDKAVLTNDVPETTILIGNPYSMKVTTVNPEMNAENGAIVCDRRSVAEIEIAVLNASQFKAGRDEAHLEEAKLGPQSVYDENCGHPVSGSIRMPVAGSYSDSASVTVTSDVPLPCTILAINAKVSIG